MNLIPIRLISVIQMCLKGVVYRHLMTVSFTWLMIVSCIKTWLQVLQISATGTVSRPL